MFSEIAKRFQGEMAVYHPYATITERKAWDGLDRQWREETLRLGEEYLGFEWPYLTATEFMDFCRTGNRSRYEDRYFPKRRALAALVLAECVENKGRFMDDIVNGIFAICDESAWNLPAHNWHFFGTNYPIPDVTNPIIDLFACETGAVMATTLYLLEPSLEKMGAPVAKRIRYELKRRVYTPYLTERFEWMGNGKDRLNNWTPWCTQNVLLSAFLVSGCEDRRKEILEKACRSVDYFLDEYGDDGCCDEGAQYYHHAGLCLGIIQELCNEVTQGAFEGIAKETKIRNMADYLFKVHVDDIYYVNFADCSPVAGRCAAREYLFAKMTENPAMMAFTADDFRRGLPYTLLIREENNLFCRLMNGFTISELRQFAAEPTPPPDVYYPSVGLMMVRDEKLVLAAKAGDNGDSHNHNDVGSFTVYRNGKPLFIDVGVETYSRKTFSEHRYEIWTMQSSYHNLPEINGYMQLPGQEYCAGEVRCDLEKCVLRMDLAGAYPAESRIASYQRTARLNKGQDIVIEDRFLWKEGGGEENKLTLSLMTYEKPVLCEAGKDGAECLKIGEEGGRLTLENARVSAVEEIPITDDRLQNAWKHEVYRILVRPEGDKIVLRIS